MPIELESGGVRMRTATPADADLLCEWWNDPGVMEHAGFPNGLGTNLARVVQTISRNDNSRQLMILESEHLPVGEIHFRLEDESSARIGIKICNPDYQGRGIGSTSLTMLIAYLFDERDCQRIVLDTNMKNIRAQHVYEKLGFRVVALRPDSWKNQLGELQGSVDYELKRKAYDGTELSV